MVSSMQAAEPFFAGWDVGGAHLKACWMQRGQVLDVAQWPCPLWQGLQHLEAALAAAQQRWPALSPA
jgi:(4-(4-[2-(gamma-L-glutamylamino)ethyl]phenoxymethyl)furan-2-yl)methanamine synthase